MSADGARVFVLFSSTRYKPFMPNALVRLTPSAHLVLVDALAIAPRVDCKAAPNPDPTGVGRRGVWTQIGVVTPRDHSRCAGQSACNPAPGSDPVMINRLKALRRRSAFGPGAD